MKRHFFWLCATVCLLGTAMPAEATPANEYNDRNFNDRVERKPSLSNPMSGAAYKYNDRRFSDRVEPQRFNNWGTNAAGSASTSSVAKPAVPLDESKKPKIVTKRTDPATLKKQANKPKPPKRELSYRPWDAYDPKEKLPPPPKPE